MSVFILIKTTTFYKLLEALCLFKKNRNLYHDDKNRLSLTSNDHILSLRVINNYLIFELLISYLKIKHSLMLYVI